MLTAGYPRGCSRDHLPLTRVSNCKLNVSESIQLLKQNTGHYVRNKGEEHPRCFGSEGETEGGLSAQEEDVVDSPDVHFEPLVKLPPVEIKTMEESEKELFKM